MSEQQKGKIKTINSKGFGFITGEGDIDYFFHYKDYNQGNGWKQLVQKFLVAKHNNQQVEVTFMADLNGSDGPCARSIEVISDDSIRS